MNRIRVVLSRIWVVAVFILMAGYTPAPFSVVPLSWIIVVAIEAPPLCLGVALVGVWLTRGP
jgi:hypothetical protein